MSNNHKTLHTHTAQLNTVTHTHTHITLDFIFAMKLPLSIASLPCTRLTDFPMLQDHARVCVCVCVCIGPLSYIHHGNT